jgi:hypothetical protein
MVVETTSAPKPSLYEDPIDIAFHGAYCRLWGKPSCHVRSRDDGKQDCRTDIEAIEQPGQSAEDSVEDGALPKLEVSVELATAAWALHA